MVDGVGERAGNFIRREMGAHKGAEGASGGRVGEAFGVDFFLRLGPLDRDGAEPTGGRGGR